MARAYGAAASVGIADAYHARAGAWPHAHSGAVADAPGETWRGVDAALRGGHRGLRGGDSLFRLLGRHGKGAARPPDDLEARVRRVEQQPSLFGAEHDTERVADARRAARLYAQTYETRQK